MQDLNSKAARLAPSTTVNKKSTIKPIVILMKKKPWSLKNPEQQPEVQAICTMGLNLFRLMMIYLKPILPNMANKVELFLNVEPFQWNDSQTALINHTIQTFQPLAQRLDKKNIDALKNAATMDITDSSVTQSK